MASFQLVGPALIATRAPQDPAQVLSRVNKMMAEVGTHDEGAASSIPGVSPQDSVEMILARAASMTLESQAASEASVLVRASRTHRAHACARARLRVQRLVTTCDARARRRVLRAAAHTRNLLRTPNLQRMTCHPPPVRASDHDQQGAAAGWEQSATGPRAGGAEVSTPAPAAAYGAEAAAQAAAAAAQRKEEEAAAAAAEAAAMLQRLKREADESERAARGAQAKVARRFFSVACCGVPQSVAAP